MASDSEKYTFSVFVVHFLPTYDTINILYFLEFEA